MTNFGHSVGTNCVFWSEIGQALGFLLGLIHLIIVYEQDIIGQSLAIVIYDQ